MTALTLSVQATVTHVTELERKVVNRMSQNNTGTVDQRVLDALPGGEKIKFLLRHSGLDLRGFARRYDHWREDVSRCVHGHKECPEIWSVVQPAFKVHSSPPWLFFAPQIG